MKILETKIIIVAFIFFYFSAPVAGTNLSRHCLTCSPLPIHRNSHLLSRGRRLNVNYSSEDMAAVHTVSMSQRVKGRRKKEEDDSTAPPHSELSNLSYDDLGPLGKTIAGCTEIVFATAFDYCSGFLQGILFGTLFGTPGFIFRPATKGVRQPFMTEISSRFSRMNTRSMSWAKNFARISAAFGGFGVAVKVLRNGEKDAWNDIFSSAAAGAFFARKEGPQAMLRGALLYGGLIYATTSGSRNRQIQDYTEKPALEDF